MKLDLARSRTLVLALTLAGLTTACGNESGAGDASGAGGSGAGNAGVGGATAGSGGATAGGGAGGSTASGAGGVGGGAGAGGAGSGGGAGTSNPAGGTSAGTGAAGGAGAGNGGSLATGGTAGISGSAGATAAGAGGSGNATNDGNVRFLGRVDASDPTAVKFAWSNSGLIATVRGTTISVSLETAGGASAAFFQPIIDGVAGTRFQVPSGAAATFVLGENLADAEHVVELYRESEGMYGHSVFHGFVAGEVVGAPAGSGRLIEVVGDSISAGYGSLGNDIHPPWDVSCPFTLDTQSSYVSYAAILGRAFDAEVSIVARSGWGMYRDLGGSTANVLSSVYANTLGVTATPAYDFAREPDAVIINLGTNDSNPDDPGVGYEDAYVAFLGTVRSHYASAWIFLTMGPMTGDPLLTTMRTRIDSVVTRAADPRVVAVPLQTQDSSTTGCDYHPDVDEHARMAAALEPVLATNLGW